MYKYLPNIGIIILVKLTEGQFENSARQIYNVDKIKNNQKCPNLRIWNRRNQSRLPLSTKTGQPI